MYELKKDIKARFIITENGKIVKFDDFTTAVGLTTLEIYDLASILQGILAAKLLRLFKNSTRITRLTVAFSCNDATAIPLFDFVGLAPSDRNEIFELLQHYKVEGKIWQHVNDRLLVSKGVK